MLKNNEMHVMVDRCINLSNVFVKFDVKFLAHDKYFCPSLL